MAEVQYYVKCERLGDFPKTYPVSSIDPKDLSVPLDRVYRFCFYAKSFIRVDNVETLTMGSKESISGWYYIGTRLTLTEVKQQYPNHELLPKMEETKCDAVLVSNETLLLLPPDAKIYTP